VIAPLDIGIIRIMLYCSVLLRYAS